MDRTGLAVLFGVLFFVVPAAFFGWLVMTNRGKGAWTRIADKQQAMSQREPRTIDDVPVLRWLVKHPVIATAIAVSLEILLALTAGWRAVGPMTQIGVYWVATYLTVRRSRRTERGSRP